MSFTIGATLHRKAGLSLDKFKTYLEGHHIPLVLGLVGSTGQPSTTYRYYPVKHGDTPLVFHGDATKVDWDCFSTFVFKNEAHLKCFKEGYDAHADEIKADEKRFLDLTRTVVVAYQTNNTSIGIDYA